MDNLLPIFTRIQYIVLLQTNNNSPKSDLEHESTFSLMNNHSHSLQKKKMQIQIRIASFTHDTENRLVFMFNFTLWYLCFFFYFTCIY